MPRYTAEPKWPNVAEGAASHASGARPARLGAAATVGSVKAGSDNYCQFVRNVVEVNEVTVSAYAQGAGWFFKLKLARAADADALMDEAAYLALVG